MWRTIASILGGLVAWAVVVTLLNFGLARGDARLSCRRGDAAIHA